MAAVPIATRSRCSRLFLLLRPHHQYMCHQHLQHFSTIHTNTTSTTTTPPPLDILYQDSHLIVVNKPPGTLSQAADSRTQTHKGRNYHETDPLLEQVRAYIKNTTDKKGEAYLGLVHRLDRNTSGAHIFALRSKSAARLSSDFKQKEVKKIYIAVVMGELQGSGTLKNTLTFDSNKNRTRISPGPGTSQPQGEEEGKDKNTTKNTAILHFQALHHFNHHLAGNETLVKIDLITGKKHQIRAQLSHLGHPIAGDVKYGAPTRFRDKSLALHCRQLTFRHPSFTLPLTKEEKKEGRGGGEGEGESNSSQNVPTTKEPERERRVIVINAPLPEVWRGRFGDEVVEKIEKMSKS